MICTLLAAHYFTYAQRIYQSGNYGDQSQKSYITLKGVLMDKYKNRHFYWFAMQNNQETFYVNIAEPHVYEKAKLKDTIILSDCFKLDSKQWKRKKNNN